VVGSRQTGKKAVNWKILLGKEKRACVEKGKRLTPFSRKELASPLVSGTEKKSSHNTKKGAEIRRLVVEYTRDQEKKGSGTSIPERRGVTRIFGQ